MVFALWQSFTCLAIMTDGSLISVSNNHSSEEHDLCAVYAGAKHRITMLEQQLENMKDMGTKHKSYVGWILVSIKFKSDR